MSNLKKSDRTGKVVDLGTAQASRYLCSPEGCEPLA